MSTVEEAEPVLSLWFVDWPSGGGDYDEYLNMVVAAYSSAAAIAATLALGHGVAWAASANELTATLLGTAAPNLTDGEIVADSYHAG